MSGGDGKRGNKREEGCVRGGAFALFCNRVLLLEDCVYIIHSMTLRILFHILHSEM